MPSYTGFTATHRYFALAIGFVAAAWFVTVPAVLTIWSFLGLVGVFMAFGWIIRITYLNAQPASSLAQSLHDAEQLSRIPGRAQMSVEAVRDRRQ